MKRIVAIVHAAAIGFAIAASGWFAPACAQMPSAAAPTAQPSSPPISLVLRGLLASARLPDLRWPDFNDYQKHAQDFYAVSGFTPVWLSGAEPTPAAIAIIQELENADVKGLRAQDYDGGRWNSRVAQLRASPGAADRDRASFDLALTICLMRYISDLRIGRVSPKAVHFGFDVEHKKYDLPALLRDKFVNARPGDVHGLIVEVEPPYPAYWRAQKVLETYSGLAAADDVAGLPAPSKAIAPGESYPALPQLVDLLHRVGDLDPQTAAAPDPPVYPQSIVDAVKSFQRRHGIDSDGRISAATIKEMNVPMSRRAEQLRLALERWRWVPVEFAQPPIVVNIPEFQLRGFGADSEPEIRIPVVVGKAFRHQTPVFTGNLRYLVFRPYWNVPLSIQRNELLPKIRKDRGYLAKNGYEVASAGGSLITDGAVTDELIPKIAAGEVFLRQKPGPKNALGLVKFIFPNDYSVYLHDSPAISLFARTRRDFSHGCIRVQDPLALAVWVLRNQPGWDRARVIATMSGSADNVRVNLDHPIPVLIIYRTAVVPSDGRVYFFHDLYGHDAELEQVLAKGYPFP